MTGRSISKKVWIKSSPETVYSALTDARELVRWFCDRATCDPREGKELVAAWKSGRSMRRGRARFTKVVPNSTLELAWIDDGDDVRPQSSDRRLSYEIHPKSGMTEMVMRDIDEAYSDEETFQFFDQGWNSVLMELKDYCEHKERAAKPTNKRHSKKPA